MKSRIIVTIETDEIHKLAKDELDKEGDQVIDETASRTFEKYIHHYIGVAIAGFVEDADRLDGDVIESLTTEGYDMETLMTDPIYGTLQELGKVTITVTKEQHPTEKKQP
jgi:hypothetical protein